MKHDQQGFAIRHQDDFQIPHDILQQVLGPAVVQDTLDDGAGIESPVGFHQHTVSAKGAGGVGKLEGELGARGQTDVDDGGRAAVAVLAGPVPPSDDEVVETRDGGVEAGGKGPSEAA